MEGEHRLQLLLDQFHWPKAMNPQLEEKRVGLWRIVGGDWLRVPFRVASARTFRLQPPNEAADLRGVRRSLRGVSRAHAQAAAGSKMGGRGGGSMLPR